MNFNIETIGSIKDEILPLLERHYDEIAVDKGKIKLNPDWHKYQAAEDEGGLAVYAARNEASNELLGYAAFFIYWHPHYVDTLIAQNDVVYLVPEMRGNRDGVKFIQYCDKDLTNRLQADKITWHVKKQHDWGHLLEAMDYSAEDTIYSRVN